MMPKPEEQESHPHLEAELREQERSQEGQAEGEQSGQALHEEELRQLAKQCCCQVGLTPERDADDVISLAEQDPEEWEECCDGGCDPCVSLLQSAALQLKRRRAR